jgi:anti-anti-sigma regulatory factor
VHTQDRTGSLTGLVRLERHGDTRLLRLEGDVDDEVLRAFTRRYGAAPEEVAVDVIDAGAVTYLGLAGMRFLVAVHEASLAAGRAGTLARRSRCVVRLAALCDTAATLAG